MDKDTKTLSFTSNSLINAGIEQVLAELGPVWQEALGTVMTRSEAIRWAVQAGLRAFADSQDALPDLLSTHKAIRTIALDPHVNEALPKLQEKLKEMNFPYGENKDLELLHGPVVYTVSTTVQAALTAHMRALGVLQ